jgi:serine/threonine protein kinase
LEGEQALSDDFSSDREAAGSLPVFPGLLPGGFRVISTFKDNGEKQVRLLQDEATGVLYVLKIAPKEYMPALRREYDLLMRLHDDAFPHPAACFAEREGVYFLREYIPGRSLAELVEAEGPLPERRAVDILRKASDAVGKLHDLVPPVIHRDIKPQNVVLSPDGGVHLIDLDAVEEEKPDKSLDTVAIGNALTAAPEQYGYRRCDVRTDVFALGKLMIYLMTGGYALPARRPRSISRPVWRVLSGCVRFDPAMRPASAHQLNAMLEARGRRLRRRLRLAACVALILAVAVGFHYGGEPLIRFLQSVSILATDPVYHFSSPLIEQAVRLQLGRPEGIITRDDLKGVAELYLYASTPYKTWDEMNKYIESSDDTLLSDLSDLDSMPNLRKLGLGRLGIKDISEIGKLSLTHLSLKDNDISDLSPLFQIQTLQQLNLTNNPVFDLSGLEQCRILQSLDIDGVPLSNLAVLGKMHLKELRMCDMQPDLDCSTLTRLDGLQTIIVRGLNRGQVGELEKMRSLTSAMLFSCDIGDLEPFAQMPYLGGLSLWGSKVDGLQPVSSMKTLVGLELRDCSLDSIEALRGNATLKSLNISKNPLKDFSVLNTMPKLKEVICSTDQREQIEALPGDKAFNVVYEDK